MTPWLHLPSYRITEPVLANGRVFVGDEGDPAAPRPAGVLVFDATTGAAVGARLDCGLPPYDLAVEPP
jgi:hypothetical protein